VLGLEQVGEQVGKQVAPLESCEWHSFTVTLDFQHSILTLRGGSGWGGWHNGAGGVWETQVGL